jgi:transposase
MRPKGSAEALEVRRQIAGRLLQEGMGIRQVARLVNAAPASVFRWKKALKEGGKEALAAKPHPGRPPRLPAYAPDLNPVELVWNRAKYSDVANFIPEDVHDLHQAITTSLKTTATQSSLIRSFFRHSGLEL